MVSQHLENRGGTAINRSNITLNDKTALLGIKWADATGTSELVMRLRTRYCEVEVIGGCAH